MRRRRNGAVGYDPGMAHLAVFVLYFLWFSIVFAVVVLWFVALSDIKSRARKGAFTAIQLSFMAVAVSVAAAGTLVTANAVVRHGWIEAVPKAVAAPPAKTECENPSFTYSFGLDGANAPQNCAAKTAERLAGNRVFPSVIPNPCSLPAARNSSNLFPRC